MNNLLFLYRIGIGKIQLKLWQRCVDLWQSFLGLFFFTKQRTWLRVCFYIAVLSHAVSLLIQFLGHLSYVCRFLTVFCCAAPQAHRWGWIWAWRRYPFPVSRFFVIAINLFFDSFVCHCSHSCIPFWGRDIAANLYFINISSQPPTIITQDRMSSCIGSERKEIKFAAVMYTPSIFRKPCILSSFCLFFLSHSNFPRNVGACPLQAMKLRKR